MKLIDRLIAWNRDRRQFAKLKKRYAYASFDELEFAAKCEAITPQQFNRLCGRKDWRDYSPVPWSQTEWGKKLEEERSPGFYPMAPKWSLQEQRVRYEAKAGRKVLICCPSEDAAAGVRERLKGEANVRCIVVANMQGENGFACADD